MQAHIRLFVWRGSFLIREKHATGSARDAIFKRVEGQRATPVPGIYSPELINTGRSGINVKKLTGNVKARIALPKTRCGYG
jgi:hypothetical protein